MGRSLMRALGEARQRLGAVEFALVTAGHPPEQATLTCVTPSMTDRRDPGAIATERERGMSGRIVAGG